MKVNYCQNRNALRANGLTARRKGRSGNRYPLVALAECALSKRTEVYCTVDFDKVSGAASVELPGKKSQTGVALGLRTIF